MKYPIGIQTFSKIRNDGYVYVDKTMYIRDLINSGQYFFLSRPRRFGKSLLISTLEAFFQGQKELFEGLAIAETETEWTEYPVIRIDFASMETTSPEGTIKGVMQRLEKVAYNYHLSIPPSKDSPSSAFGYLVERLHESTGKCVVVLIDEYDKGIIETIRDEAANQTTMDVLRPFFSVLKSHDEHIRFAFITGVSRFRNTTIFSGFNNPDDISLDEKYAAICGVTKEELLSYFEEGIAQIGKKYNLSRQEAITVILDKYGGYRFTEGETLVCNPFSLLNALSKTRLSDYWVMSGTSKILVEYLRESEFSLDELTSRWVSDKKLSSTYEDSDPLSLFFQTGYLTIADCKPNGFYRLRIPNQEVQAALVELLIPEFVQGLNKRRVDTIIQDLTTAINEGDVDTMMQLLRSLISSVPYQDIDTKVHERHIHLCMYIIFMMLGVSTRCEQSIASGRVDMVAQTPWRVYVMEFKIDSTPQEAMNQINSKGYAIPWETDNRIVTKIGINFSSHLHTIESWIYSNH